MLTDRELLELLVNEVAGIKNEVHGIEESLSRMESKLDLVYSHTAQLTEDVTMIKKEMVPPEEIRQRFEDMTETQKSLIDMYGQHEVAIRSLQRRPV